MNARAKSQRTTRKPSPAVPSQATDPAAEQADGPSRQQIRDKVLKYIEGHPGVTVYADDMANDLSANRNSIQAAVRGLQERLPQIVTVVGGKAWRWEATAKANSGKRMFEELTTTKAGIVLVQDEDGNVYKLDEL